METQTVTLDVTESEVGILTQGVISLVSLMQGDAATAFNLQTLALNKIATLGSAEETVDHLFDVLKKLHEPFCENYPHDGHVEYEKVPPGEGGTTIRDLSNPGMTSGGYL